MFPSMRLFTDSLRQTHRSPTRFFTDWVTTLILPIPSWSTTPWMTPNSNVVQQSPTISPSFKWSLLSRLSSLTFSLSLSWARTRILHYLFLVPQFPLMCWTNAWTKISVTNLILVLDEWMSFFNMLLGAQILQVLSSNFFSLSLWVFLLWPRLYVRIGKFVFFLLQIRFVCWVTQFETFVVVEF